MRDQNLLSVFAAAVLATTGMVGSSTALGASIQQQQAAPPVIEQPQQRGPQVQVQPPHIEWGDERDGVVPYQWDAVVENPNDRPVLVKVQLSFVSDEGEVLHEDWVKGQIGPHGSVVMRQTGTVAADDLERVVEARGAPAAWWSDEPYKIRTLAAFVDGLQRLEVFFVLEDWQGRPVIAAGTVDLYIVERERARAEFDEGGIRRRLTTLYARRFNIHTGDFARRRIGFINTDYTPPAVTLGPIHYSMFDREPRGDEGLVRVVFRTVSGVQIVAEDRVYF